MVGAGADAARRICFFAPDARGETTVSPLSLWLVNPPRAGSRRYGAGLVVDFGDGGLYCVDHARIAIVLESAPTTVSSARDRSISAGQSVAPLGGDDSVSTTDLLPKQASKEGRDHSRDHPGTPQSSGAGALSIAPGQADVSSERTGLGNDATSLLSAGSQSSSAYSAQREKLRLRPGASASTVSSHGCDESVPSPPFVELGLGTVALRVWLERASPAGCAAARLSPRENTAMNNALRDAVTRLRDALNKNDRSLFMSVDRASGEAAKVAAEAVASSAAPPDAAVEAAPTQPRATSCSLADALAAVDEGQQAWDDVAAALQRLAHVCSDGGAGGTVASAAALANELACAYARTLRRPARRAVAVSRDPAERALLAEALGAARGRAERALDTSFSSSKEAQARASKRRRVAASGGTDASAAEAKTSLPPQNAKARERMHEELAIIAAAQIWLATTDPC